MKLSVIIPNYNKAKYIRRCIESIEAQTYKDYRIIVVDDCSTDESADIIREMCKIYDNITAIYREENQGVSEARNLGLNTADTDYVTFIDSDDYYANERKLENEMKLLMESGEPDKAIAYSLVKYVDCDDRELPYGFCKGDFIYVYGKHPLGELLSLKKLYVGPRDYCISRKTLLSVGAYSFEKNLYEDLDLLMRLAASGVRFICTRQMGTAYRQNTGGLSSAKMQEHKTTRKMITDKYRREASVRDKIVIYKTKLVIFIYEGLRFIKRRITRRSNNES